MPITLSQFGSIYAQTVSAHLKTDPESLPGLSHVLIVFALSCCFGLLLASYARLLVMLSLTNLLLDTSLCTASLEATQCTVQCFVLFNDYV